MLVLGASTQDYSQAFAPSEVRFPATCAETQEPVLLAAVLLQLGKKPVAKATPTNIVQLDVIPASTQRVQVYRDEITVEWTDFLQKPMKYIMEVLVPLQKCTEDPCSCPKWHGAPDQPDQEALLDVWRRQHTKLGYQPATPEHSSLYTVSVRVPASVQDVLQGYSGTRGVYVEPRSDNGLAPSMTCSVVWLPRADLQAAMLQKQTCQALGVVRLGTKYGVRVRTTEAAKQHEALRPDTPFIAAGSRKVYTMGPWPYGTQRTAIVKVLKQIQWQAKPVQPAGSDPNVPGTFWQLQAVDPPPMEVVTTQHGEMVIAVAASPSIQHGITPGTRAVRRSEPSGSEDPWLRSDPWQASASRRPAAQGSGGVSSEALQRLEQRMQVKLEAKVAELHVPAPDGSNDAARPDPQVHSRLQTLEQQLQAVQAQQGRMEQWTTDSIKQHGAQISQLQVSVETQSAQMTRLFDQQMERIEQLMAKRSRNE